LSDHQHNEGSGEEVNIIGRIRWFTREM